MTGMKVVAAGMIIPMGQILIDPQTLMTALEKGSLSVVLFLVLYFFYRDSVKREERRLKQADELQKESMKVMAETTVALTEVRDVIRGCKQLQNERKGLQ